MTVCFYGRIKEHTNGDKSYIPTSKEHSTLRSLLDELIGYYGESFDFFINSSETCLLLVNGRGIKQTGGLDTPVSRDDKIEILPFVEAG